MKTDLISRNDLYDVVEASLIHNPHKVGPGRVQHRTEHLHFLKLITDAPSIEAEPVRHAYWKPLKVYPDEFVCSWCGELWNDVKTPYCHECGAKMDGESEVTDE